MVHVHHEHDTVLVSLTGDLSPQPQLARCRCTVYRDTILYLHITRPGLRSGSLSNEVTCALGLPLHELEEFKDQREWGVLNPGSSAHDSSAHPHIHHILVIALKPYTKNDMVG
jgi:hypothetical protein